MDTTIAYFDCSSHTNGKIYVHVSRVEVATTGVLINRNTNKKIAHRDIDMIRENCKRNLATALSKWTTSEKGMARSLPG